MAKSPSNEVCEYMDKLVQELCRSAPKAMKKWDPNAIHNARVATRRLKAAVDLLSPLTEPEYRKPFAKALKSIRRRLGPLRDLDVMLEHLQESRVIRHHAGVASWVADKLRAERTAHRKKFTGKTSPSRILARLGAWLGYREEIAELLEAAELSPVISHSLHTQLDSFSEHAAMLQDNASVSAAERTQDDPHALRIAGKRLRYTLELAGIAGHPLPSAAIAHFKQMQEALGLWHDWAVLSQKVMRLALEDEAACHHRALYEQLLNLSASLWRQAEHHLKRFSTLWQSCGSELITSIHQTFPLPVANPIPAATQTTPLVLPIIDTPSSNVAA